VLKGKAKVPKKISSIGPSNMDKTQIFIKDYILSRGEKDELELEKRLTSNLIIAAAKKKKRSPKKLKSLVSVHDSGLRDSLKQSSYKKVTRNSKKILRNYIVCSKSATETANKIIATKEQKGEVSTLEKPEKYEYIKKNYPDVYKDLPLIFDSVYESLYKKMWLPYIKEVLRISDRKSLETINMQNSLLKLSIADYNGCLLKVVKSSNKTTVNTEGIVLWDAQKSFIILVKQADDFDALKIIPKKGSLFEISIPLNMSGDDGHDTDNVIFNIVGDRFQYRSSDRSGKKFKNRRVDDMLFYLFKDSSNARA